MAAIASCNRRLVVADAEAGGAIERERERGNG